MGFGLAQQALRSTHKGMCTRPTLRVCLTRNQVPRNISRFEPVAPTVETGFVQVLRVQIAA